MTVTPASDAASAGVATALASVDATSADTTADAKGDPDVEAKDSATCEDAVADASEETLVVDAASSMDAEAVADREGTKVSLADAENSLLVAVASEAEAVE